ncbi:hypothetical protein N9O56_03340, partial [Rickettsiales bacterium]|nr:hypothetical protein [Rickettsiales bacterium]
KKQYEENKRINDQINNPNQDKISVNSRSVNCGDVILVDFTKKNDINIEKEKNYNMKIDKSDLALGIIGMKINENRTIIAKEQLADGDIKFIYNVKLIDIIESNADDICF